MPLPEPVARTPAHTRSITYQGFRREDGLWDIEAHMTDVKSYSFQNHFRGTIEAGEPMHEMLLRVTVDDDFVIQEVTAVTDNSPFEICPDIVEAYQSLAGIKMGPGWRRNIRQVVGGVRGCTHLTELLFPMATVAMQTLWAFKNHRRRKNRPGPQPRANPPRHPRHLPRLGIHFPRGQTQRAGVLLGPLK